MLFFLIRLSCRDYPVDTELAKIVPVCHGEWNGVRSLILMTSAAESYISVGIQRKKAT